MDLKVFEVPNIPVGLITASYEINKHELAALSESYLYAVNAYNLYRRKVIRHFRPSRRKRKRVHEHTTSYKRES